MEPISFIDDLNQYIPCSSEEVQAVILNSIFINYVLHRSDDQKTEAHITYSQFWNQYKKRVEEFSNDRSIYSVPDNSNNVTVRTNEHAAIVFDAVWAIALALNEVEKSFVNLTEYGLKLGSSEHSNMIRDILYDNEFEGASGHIKINSSTGYTEREIEIGQGGVNVTYNRIGNFKNSTLNITNKPVIVAAEYNRRGLFCNYSSYYLALFAVIGFY